jgi:hypothetical protein
LENEELEDVSDEEVEEDSTLVKKHELSEAQKKISKG